MNFQYVLVNYVLSDMFNFKLIQSLDPINRFSAMLRKEMVHFYDTQCTEGYCEVILIKN